MVIKSNSQFQVRDFVSVFKAYSDETRLRIVHILSYGPLNVNEIVEVLEMGQSRISRHLKILVDAGILSANREGSWVYYRISNFSELEFPSQLTEILLSYKDRMNDFVNDVKKIELIQKNRIHRNKTYFNTIAENFDKIQEKVFHPSVYREKILDYIPGNKGTILDLGCGPGGLISDLSKISEKVIGIDISNKMIATAREKNKSNKKASFIESKLEEIPLKSQSASAVVASMVLHHVSNPPLLIQEAERLLSKNGVFCLVDLLKHNKEFMRELYSDLWLGFEPDQLKVWLEEAGFDIKQIDQVKTQTNFTILTIKAVKKGVLNVRKK